MEEPPSHVVFILATTEEDKLLDTIKSRCQIFRFRAPSRAVLAATVADVAKKEGFKLKKDAADLIAVAADGSFRDALSVTQKVILASGDEIGSADEVAAIIGAPKSSILTDVIEALQGRDVEKGIEAVRGARDTHVDMKLFLRLVLERVRAIMLVRNVPARKDEYLESFSEDDAARLTELAGEKESPINSHLLVRLLSAAEQMNWTHVPELPLELAIIDLCQKE